MDKFQFSSFHLFCCTVPVVCVGWARVAGASNEMSHWKCEQPDHDHEHKHEQCHGWHGYDEKWSGWCTSWSGKF